MSHPVTTDSAASMLKGIIWSLFAYAAYSSHDALVKVLREYSIFQVIFFAMLFGLLPFTLSRLRDPKPVSLRPVKPAWVAARCAFGVGTLLFAFSAFKLLPMVQVYVLLFLSPLIVTIAAIPVLGERVHLIRWTAIFVGLAGILIVLRPTPQNLEWGHLLGLGAACCGAGGAIIARKVSGIEHRSTLILYPILTTILLSGVAMLFVYQPMPLSDLLFMFAIGMLGLMGQASILQAFRQAPAAVIAPMQYSQLIWANFFGILFFGDSIDTWIIVGSLITVASGLLIIWRETQPFSTQPNLRNRQPRSVAGVPMVGMESSQEAPRPSRNQG